MILTIPDVRLNGITKVAKKFAIIAGMDLKYVVQVYLYWLISTELTVFQFIISAVAFGYMKS